MSKKKKSQLIINLEYILAVPLIKLIRLIPLMVTYKLAKVLGRIVYTIDFRHRKRTIQHLIHAGVTSDMNEARAIARANFINLAKLAVEVFKLNTIINHNNCHSHLKVTGSQKAKNMFFTKGKEQQSILITAHYGNWEVLGKNFKQIFGRHVTALMKKFDNPKIGEYVYNERYSEDSSTIVFKRGGIRHLIKALKRDETVCLLVDQHPARQAGVEVKFFDQPARAHTSPAILHLKTGVPILPFVVRRKDENAHFEIVCKDPIIYKPTEDKDVAIKEITQQITTALEELIRECPDQWIWCHRRWLNINRKS